MGMARANATNPPHRESILIEGGDDENPHELSYEEFEKRYDENPRALYDKLLKTYQKNMGDLLKRDTCITEEQLRNQAKEGELISLCQEKEAVEKKYERALTDRNVYANQIAKMTIQAAEANESSGSGVPMTGAGGRKPVKIPDPPLLTDGKEPRFNDWLLLMNQKLSAKDDHFNSSQLRMAYVASRCEGKARKHIAPRMREDTPNPYTDSKDMLEHLKSIYSDPNRVTTAKHEFRQLYMKTSDKFHDFHSEFLCLAAEAGVAEEDWKDELYYKLTTELQKMCISDSIKDGTFQEFSSAVSQTANRLEIINYRTQKNRSFNSSFSTNKSPMKNTTRAPTIKQESTSNHEAIPRVSNRERLMKEEKCFHCQTQGHLARNCPTNRSPRS